MCNFSNLILILACATLIAEGKVALERVIESDSPEPAFTDAKRDTCCDDSCPKKDSKNQCIAAKAAQAAKEAQDLQQAAAMAAAKQVKIQLAEKAFQAAKAAEAAYNGKQAMVESLECQVRDAQALAQQELSSCLQTQANLQSALNTAAQAGHLLKALIISLQISEANLALSQQTVSGQQHEMEQKLALYEAAKCRAEFLMRELFAQRQELCFIKQAACKAITAARNTQCNILQRLRRAPTSSKRSNNHADRFLVRNPNFGFFKSERLSDKFKYSSVGS